MRVVHAAVGALMFVAITGSAGAEEWDSGGWREVKFSYPYSVSSHGWTVSENTLDLNQPFEISAGFNLRHQGAGTEGSSYRLQMVMGKITDAWGNNDTEYWARPWLLDALRIHDVSITSEEADKGGKFVFRYDPARLATIFPDYDPTLGKQYHLALGFSDNPPVPCGPGGCDWGSEPLPTGLSGEFVDLKVSGLIVTPEPASILLLALGGAPILLRSLRRSKAAAA